jgi:ATP-binding protein involved in chromosome partitioning
LFEKVNIPMIGVVENMSYYPDSSGERKYLFGKGGGERLSREIGAPLLGEIPIDPEVCRCGDAGIDLLSQAGGISPAAHAIQEISEAFVAHAALLKRASEECLTAFSLKWEEKA